MKPIDPTVIYRDIQLEVSSEAEELAAKFGYQSYMIQRYIHMFGFEGILKLIEGFEKRPKPVVRVNTLLVEPEDLYLRLYEKGFELETIDWYPYAFRVLKEPVKPTIGSTHEYMKGYYYVYRDAAPLIPVILLTYGYCGDVFDACAAPGGKTTFIAELIHGCGRVFANDLVLRRIKSMVSHIIRMKLKNVVVTWSDLRKFPYIIKRKFSRILLDAPCSGEGVIALDPSRKLKTNLMDLAVMASRQITLLNVTLDLLEKNGVLIYTTCSIAPEENEYVVSRILELRSDVEVVEPEVKLFDWDKGFRFFHKLEFNPMVEKCVRITPFKHDSIGLTICVLMKTN